jgi:predicted AAA+ superfamily ATPase
LTELFINCIANLPCIFAMQLIISEVSRDLGVAVNTIKRYLELLTMSFQCVLLPPWHGNVSKRLVKSPKPC